MTFYLSKSNCGSILAWILSPRLVKKKKCKYIYGVILWSSWTIVLLYIIMHVSHCIPFLFPKVLVPIANSYLSCSQKKKSFSIKLSKELRKREKEKLRLHRLNKLDAKMKMMMIRNIWRQLQLPMLFLLAKREHLSMCNPANSQEGNF